MSKAYIQAYIHCHQCDKLIFAEKTHNGICEVWLGHCCGFGQDAPIGEEVNPVVCEDGIHCGDCPYLEPYGDYERDLTAKCNLTGNDLMWYDYWIAECDVY